MVTASTDIDAPPAAVWAMWHDVRTLPQLSPNTVEVRDAPERLTEAGQSFCQVVKVGPKRFEARWTVAGIVPGRCLAVEGDAPMGGRYRLTQEVEALGEDRSRATITVQYDLPFGPLGRLASRLGVDRRAETEVHQVLANLKRLVEKSPAAGGGTLGPPFARSS